MWNIGGVIWVVSLWVAGAVEDGVHSSELA